MEAQGRTEKKIEVTGENIAAAQSAVEASAINKVSGAEKSVGEEGADGSSKDRAEQLKEDLLTVEGFRFTALADAKTAEEEYKKMVYINEHMNRDNPEEVLAIYDKMIENGLFVTPVGVDFLMRIREYLVDCGQIAPERIRPIETGSLFTQRARNEARAEARPRVTTNLTDEIKEVRRKYHIALATAIIAVILVIVMFILANTTDNPNIINYRTAIENQYSEWEEALTQREQAVREKEEALKNGED